VPINSYDNDTTWAINSRTMLIYHCKELVYITRPFGFHNKTELGEEINKLRDYYDRTEKNLLNGGAHEFLGKFYHRDPDQSSYNRLRYVHNDTFWKEIYRPVFGELGQGKADNIEEVFEGLTDKVAIVSGGDGVTNSPSKWTIISSEIVRNNPNNNNSTFMNMQLMIPKLSNNSEVIEADPFTLYTNHSGVWCEHHYVGPKMAIVWAQQTCFRPLPKPSTVNVLIDDSTKLEECDDNDEEKKTPNWKQGKCFNHQPEVVQVRQYFNQYVVYCFGSQLELHNGTFIDCPEYPFRISRHFEDIKIGGKVLKGVATKLKENHESHQYVSIEKSWEWNYFRNETLVSEPFVETVIIQPDSVSFWLCFYVCFLTALDIILLIATLRTNISSFRRFSISKFVSNKETIELVNEQ